MAGEHDFAPLSEADINYYANGNHIDSRRMAREIRASRAAMRALVEADHVLAADDSDPAAAGILQKRIDAIRALVAHVGAEGEGR